MLLAALSGILVAACVLVAVFVTGGGADSGPSADPGHGDGGGPGHSRSPAASQVAARRDRDDDFDNPYAGPAPKTVPPRMLGRDSSPLSESVIGPVRNGWIAGDHRTQTIVWAGAGGYGHQNLGRFAILRDGYINVSQTLDTVDVKGAGALKITKAPLGRKAMTWAQRRGNFKFTSTNGLTGTLHLKDDTVTLNP